MQLREGVNILYFSGNIVQALTHIQITWSTRSFGVRSLSYHIGPCSSSILVTVSNGFLTAGFALADIIAFLASVCVLAGSICTLRVADLKYPIRRRQEFMKVSTISVSFMHP